MEARKMRFMKRERQGQIDTQANKTSIQKDKSDPTLGNMLEETDKVWIWI